MLTSGSGEDAAFQESVAFCDSLSYPLRGLIHSAPTLPQVCSPTARVARQCLTEFVPSLFESEAPQSTERQSDLSDQIIPVAIIAFTASLFNSFVAMLFTPQAATVNCTYTGSNWKWGYEGVYGAACWGTHVPACNGVKQSPIDIPAKYGGLLPATESTPLKMSGYAAVRFGTFSNTGENYGKYQRYTHLVPPRAAEEDDDRVSNGIFKNNGHTAVS